MPRTLALKVLDRLDKDPGSPSEYLEQAIGRGRVPTPRDRAFAFNLIQGVQRWKLRLDWIISGSVRFPFKQIDPSILNVLRIALYQILFMDRVPDSAAVNEAVKEARKTGRRHVASFVNGILRQICRQGAEVDLPDRDRDKERFLSVSQSYPEWIVRKWINELGPDEAERLLEAGNLMPSLVIRTNRLKTDRQGLIKALKDEGLDAVPTGYSPDGLVLEGLRGSLAGLESFGRGLFQVQGEASQLCAFLASPGPGMRILDLCAGLGGKSTHLAQVINNRGMIVALDINRHRLLRLCDTSDRLGISCIRPVLADASSGSYSPFRTPFDLIVVDAPCSGLGNVSRHPDLKWRKDAEGIRRLARLQTDILNNAESLLKSGGRMVYMTCTISREENEDLIHGFLDRHKTMRLLDLNDHCTGRVQGLIDDRGFFRALPHVHGMEGFFGALLMKN